MNRPFVICSQIQVKEEAENPLKSKQSLFSSYDQMKNQLRSISLDDREISITEIWTNKQVSSHFEEDKLWLKHVDHCVKRNLSNNRYTIQQLAAEVPISERQFRRRVKHLLGMSPSQYLMINRLQYAHQLLSKKKYKTIKQVVHAVGLRDVGAFRYNFQQLFGIAPKKYL